MRSLFTIALAAVLMIAASAQAAPPTLTVPAKVSGQPGAFITISATTTGATVKWIVLDSGLNLFPVDLLKDSKTAIVTGGTPGGYRVLAITAANNEISDPAICTVTIAGPTPPPTPPAPPNPPTPPAPPAPAVKATWAIVVIDNTARTPAQGQLVSSPTLIQALHAGGVHYRVLDKTDPLIAENNYGPAVTAAGGLPALLLYTEKGQRVKTIPLPKDEPSFLAAVGVPAVSLQSPQFDFAPLASFASPEICNT